MKAIILAAGRGTRLKPLTNTIPKAMVEVFGKSLLEYNMQGLLEYVDEFIIVVKYKADSIKNYFGDTFKGIPITYHMQGEENGTGAAVKGIQVRGDIVIAYADAIFKQKDINAVMQNNGYAVLAKKVANPEKYGIFQINKKGYIENIIEKPQEYIGNIANFGFFKVNSSLLKYVEEIGLSQRGEIEITDAVNLFVEHNKLTPVIFDGSYTDITSIEDLEKANMLIKPKLGTTQYLENIGDYEVHLGIPKTGIMEIINYSLDKTDTAMREGTSDWKKRFISVENLTSWYNDTDRYPFTLLSSTGIVAGLWWGRPAESPNITQILNEKLYKVLQNNQNKTHTGALRIYPFARGDRLASPFMLSCSRYYDYLFQHVHMCVDIDEQNIPSQKAFEKIGFKKIGYGKNINNSPESGKQRFVYLKIS